MKEFIKLINKYAILLIIPRLFSFLWDIFIRELYFNIDNQYILNIKERLLMDVNLYLYSIPTYFSLIFNFIIIGFLIYDFRRHKLKYTLLTCIAAYFYPIFGVAVFLILYIFKEKQQIKIE